MRAFRIEKKAYLWNVLKACERIANNKRGIEKYTHIYYDAKNKTILATNGLVLLTCETDEIVKLLGDDIGNGTLVMCGDFVIFEDKKEDIFNYRKPIEEHKSKKKLHVYFMDSIKPHYCHAVMELALNGITMNPNVIKEMEQIAFYLDNVSLPKEKYQAVVFCGIEDRLKFLAIPCVLDGWDSYPTEETEKSEES